MQPPPKPKPPIHPDTLGVINLYLRKQAEEQVKRDFAQAMWAVKPSKKKE